MKIARLDHLVLTVANIEVTIAFYCQVLGMDEITFGEGRKALAFGQQKINLHEKGREFLPNARVAMPGSADLCFISSTPLEEVVATLGRLRVSICEGPVTRTGALGPIASIYIRDPDQNLIEISNYL